MLRLFNTLTRQKNLIEPIRAGEIGIYSCGPTVYAPAHIGNLRAFLFADSLQRWCRFGLHLDTKWVMNLTDVDDKTIRDSRAAFPDLDPKTALKTHTEHFAQLFFDDLVALGVDRAHFFANPKATEFIADEQNLVCKIVENGFGYIADGSVYFDLAAYRKKFPYGRLAQIDEKMAKTRIDSDEYERAGAADFVLWKGKKEGEPFWDFSLDGIDLPGRPGWHLECSAMEEAILGLPFEIHTGGVDLAFPHHEDEIAQSCAGYGIDPTAIFAHNEHLFVDGKKMSKSLGNFFTLGDLVAKGFSADAIRFFFVAQHYRTAINLTDEALRAAENSLKRLRNAAQSVTRAIPKTAIETAEKALADAMNDDLNAPEAIAALFSAISESIDGKPFPGQHALFLRFGEAFGIDFFAEERIEMAPDVVRALAESRFSARQAKNWAEADCLRAEIAAFGWTVEDALDGFRLTRS